MSHVKIDSSVYQRVYDLLIEFFHITTSEASAEGLTERFSRFKEVVGSYLSANGEVYFTSYMYFIVLRTINEECA